MDGRFDLAALKMPLQVLDLLIGEVQSKNLDAMA